MLVPSLSDQRQDIDSAYIRLHLTGAEHDHVTDSDLLESNAESSLIFGEPGSGKSSLTRKLFRDYCKQASAHPATSRLPLHAELGSIPWEKMPNESDERREWLQNEVAVRVLRSRNIHDPQKVLRSFLDGPGVILLLDGLDEVASRHLEPALDAIRSLILNVRSRSEGSTVIVTTRVQLSGVLPREFQEVFNQVLSVEGFTPADISANNATNPAPEYAERKIVLPVNVPRKPTINNAATMVKIKKLYPLTRHRTTVNCEDGPEVCDQATLEFVPAKSDIALLSPPRVRKTVLAVARSAGRSPARS